jgi:hypothetical protein
MSSSCRKLYVTLGAGALIGLAPGARADNWEFLPRIEVGGNYNDNYRMAVDSADALKVYGPYIDAQLNADWLSPRSKFEIIPRVRSDDFPTDHADQSTDGYLTLDGEYKTLRSDFSGIAQYSNETVIYSELLPATFPTVGLGEVVGGVSGLVSVRNRRQLERVTPNEIYELTPRTHLNLNADVERASFQRNLIDQTGFTNYMGSAGLGFDVSQRSVFTVSGLADHFVPQLGGQNTNRYGVNLQWDLTQSEITHFYARVGASHTEAQTPVGSVSNNGLTGGAGAVLRYQVTEVTVDALRDFAPSAAGAVVITDQVRFRVLHAFQPLLSGFVGANWYRQRGQTSQAVFAITGEDYIAAEAGADYQLSQNYRLEGTYSLTWQRFQGEPSAASNAIGLAIIYQPFSRYEPLPEFRGIPKER